MRSPARASHPWLPPLPSGRERISLPFASRVKGAPMRMRSIPFAIALVASPAFAQDKAACDAAIRESSRLFVEVAQAKHAYDAAKKEGRLDVIRDRVVSAKINVDSLDVELAKQEEFCIAINKEAQIRSLRAMSRVARDMVQAMETP